MPRPSPRGSILRQHNFFRQTAWRTGAPGRVKSPAPSRIFPGNVGANGQLLRSRTLRSPPSPPGQRGIGNPGANGMIRSARKSLIHIVGDLTTVCDLRTTTTGNRRPANSRGSTASARQAVRRAAIWPGQSRARGEGTAGACPAGTIQPGAVPCRRQIHPARYFVRLHAAFLARLQFKPPDPTRDCTEVIAQKPSSRGHELILKHHAAIRSRLGDSRSFSGVAAGVPAGAARQSST